MTTYINTYVNLVIYRSAFNPFRGLDFEIIHDLFAEKKCSIKEATDKYYDIKALNKVQASLPPVKTLMKQQKSILILLLQKDLSHLIKKLDFSNSKKLRDKFKFCQQAQETCSAADGHQEHDGYFNIYIKMHRNIVEAKHFGGKPTKCQHTRLLKQRI